MSFVGVASGRPLAGDRMLFEDSISTRASACASADSGRWTAIWSPSKSALNAWQSSGCTWIALPSTRPCSNAWSPTPCSLGAAVGRRGDRAGAAAVVEQRIDRLLQHPRLVVDDDLGRAEVEQPLQPVVPVDDAAVQVVQVARGEPAAVQLHHRAQLRGDDRDRL